MKQTPAVSNWLTPTEETRLQELEPVIESGLSNFLAVGNALAEIKQQRLYRQTYATFQDYVKIKWKISVRRAYQLCDAAEVAKSLPANVNHGSQINERQCRALAKVKPAKRAGVLSKANKRATKAGRKLTTTDIEAVVTPSTPEPTLASAETSILNPAKVLNALIALMARIPEDANHEIYGAMLNKAANVQMNWGKGKTAFAYGR